MKTKMIFKWMVTFVFLTSFLNAGTGMLQFEDDALVSKEDYRYTGGLFYGYMFDENRSFLNIPFLNEYSNINALSLTYMVFTPKDKKSKTVVLNDMPYAGYAKISLHDYKVKKNAFYRFSFNIAAVGPMVKAKQLQSNFHKLIGHTEPKGWNNQIKDHLFYGVSIGYGKKSDKFSFHSLDADVCGYIEGSAGNFYNSLFTSIAFRFGSNLPDTFAIIPNLNDASADELLNFKPFQSFNWNISIGAFANKVDKFYIIDKAINSGYKLSHIDYTYGLQLTFNLFYKNIKYSFKIKDTQIHAKNTLPFDDKRWGSFSVTWKF